MATTKFEKPLGGDLDLKIDKTSIVNNLTTNDATKVLSAAQGYTLNGNMMCFKGSAPA